MNEGKEIATISSQGLAQIKREITLPMAAERDVLLATELNNFDALQLKVFSGLGSLNIFAAVEGHRDLAQSIWF